MTYAYQNVLGSLFADAAQVDALIRLLPLSGYRFLRSRLALTRRLRALLRLGWAPGVCSSSTSPSPLRAWAHRGRFSRKAEHTAPPMGHSVAFGPNALIVGDSLFALLIALDVSRASSMSTNKSKGAIHVNEMTGECGDEARKRREAK